MNINLLKKISIALLAINFIACSLFTSAPPPKTDEVEREEQAVYSFFIKEGAGPVLILEDSATGLYTDDLREVKKYIQSSFKDVSSETIQSFVERNGQPQKLSPNMNLGVEYKLLNSDELKEITSGPNWNEVLAEKYPGSYGYVIFSRVGFNNSLNQAIVYMGRVEGPMMGSGSYYLLEKKNGEWILMDEIMVWIS